MSKQLLRGLLMQIELQSCNIDYLTLTNVHEHMGDLTLRSLWATVSGPVRNDWRAGGYTGMSCDVTGIKYGQRTHNGGGVDEILIAPGEAATLIIPHIGTDDYRVTRLDVQCTWRLAEPEPDIAKVVYDGIRMSQRLGASVVGRRKATYISSDTGATLYVGSRKSASYMIRLYDKSDWYDGADQGEYWRQEVQFGRDYAQGALKTILSGDHGAVYDLVHNYISMGCRTMLFEQQPGKHADIKLDKITRTSDTDKTLAWLKRNVAPTIRRLSDNGELGRALLALGLLDQNEHWDETLTET